MFVLTMLILPILALTGCEKKAATEVTLEKRTGELTRRLATELLNKELTGISIPSLEFKQGGFGRAVHDGLLKPHNVMTYEPPFTDKGKIVMGPFFLEKLEAASGISSGVNIDSAYLKKNLVGQERVTDVTGIKESNKPGAKEVEYAYEVSLHPSMDAIKSYFQTAGKRKALFEKYDDGWRVVFWNYGG